MQIIVGARPQKLLQESDTQKAKGKTLESQYALSWYPQ